MGFEPTRHYYHARTRTAWRYLAVRVLVHLDKLPADSLVVLYLAASLLVAVLVRRALRRSLAQIAKIRKDELSEVLAASVPRPAAIAVFLVAMAAGLRFLPLTEPRLLELHKVLALALGLLGVALVIRVALRSIDAYGRSNPELQSSAGIGKAVTWIVGLGVVAVLVSDTLGISLAPALTALGVGSLAVALALQDTLSNFFAGLYIVFDKPVRPGDFIRVDPSYEGYVHAIGWRSTHLRTLSNNLVVIPNATLSKAIITNFTLPNPHVASNVRVDFAADVDVDRVEDILGEEAMRALDLPGLAPAPAPGVSFSPGFVDGGVSFTIYFYVTSFGDQGAVQHALRKRVAARLRREGIPLASSRVILRKDG
ncbi:MAG TPA: mechanosensitive ion channel family protein [Polyangiaceae bacterium]|nr:mechanosensitive ion channel family protein [Polyangiaceae bacterium]